ncbi:diacylglycerol kinase family protein [Alkalihalobacillus sp. AL-G]|uniref:diacylglycerol/lipid kinase family protein n=1 Tax=Alkalihalobacillus sp. AL-G TaxID=2926399 RepID=UPI00272AA646|nr:diacylglycerol kinase family protein [Alkalihalobacillus sp. AL-G]WLD94089.1 diacylglycerol kinase family lipid kinase [Alkalihalobacillus sp. AL-G]
MSIERVEIIVNPQAGKNKLHKQMEQILLTLEHHFLQVNVYESREQGDVARRLENVANDVDLIIGAGGDGTIYELINALAPMEKRPALGIIPGGTCNDFSRALGISQSPLIAVEQICKQQFRKIDVGKCVYQYFLNFWGIGLITEVSTNIDPKIKESFGRLSYYLSAFQTVNEEESFRLQLESKECAYEGEAAMVLIGNGPFTGGIRAFFPGSDIEDGKLEVLVVESKQLHSFWDILRAKVMNDVPNKEGILYFQTEEVSIKAFPQRTIDCDGERVFRTPSTISVLPGHIHVAVGDYPIN